MPSRDVWIEFVQTRGLDTLFERDTKTPGHGQYEIFALAVPYDLIRCRDVVGHDSHVERKDPWKDGLVRSVSSAAGGNRGLDRVDLRNISARPFVLSFFSWKIVSYSVLCSA